MIEVMLQGVAVMRAERVGGLPVLTTSNRFRDLLAATQQIASGVALDDVLQHVADAAGRLVGAECAAVGVISRGCLVRFVYAGMKPGAITSIGLTDHSFLTIPLTVRGAVFGNLYLTEKRDGAEFSAEDQELVQALASVAEGAIENAELFAEEQRRQAWQRAMLNVTTLLLSGQDPQAILPVVVGHAMQLGGAVAAAIMVPAKDPAWLRVAAGAGVLDPCLVGEFVPAQGAISQLARIGSAAFVIDDVTADPLTSGSAARVPGLGPAVAALLGPAVAAPLGPAVAAPLGTVGAGAVGGVLLVARTKEEPSFRLPDVEMIAAFAGHAGLALTLADARRRQELVRLVEDRERIAAHLSERAMKTLLGISTTVHGLITRMRSPDDAHRLTEQVARLDAALCEMRRAIFGLQHPSAG